jgi:hypothetical protein
MERATAEAPAPETATEPAEPPTLPIHAPAVLAFCCGAASLVLSLALYDGFSTSALWTNPAAWVELFVLQPLLLSVGVAGTAAGGWSLAE